MPGGRLTHEERQQIAAWVSEGLGYAEIARRLGRPTSTVSREVARNAAPGGYVADHAHQTAGRRARRRKPVRAVQEQADGRASEFVEEFAVLLAGTGLSRMAARVFSCLITSEAGSLTAAELVRRLRVSPASVSKAIGYLEAMELVGRRPELGGRRERYVIDDDVWRRAWRADTGAHAEVARAARRGVELFGADTPAGGRLGQMGRFFGQVSEQMSGRSLTDAVVLDALTVVAALTHTALTDATPVDGAPVWVVRALTVDELAMALGWPARRVADALDVVERHPAVADPLALRHTPPGTYALTTRPDRLSPAQRAALRGIAAAT
ncbi:helix-turn-helix domain-containing protein [Nonomuraea sp. NPDC050643]|uniref:GbsR/MarR family transcriptional regulator n=1 Tax=Nonomuraea sp. NPDC050643 TaxID=3155660 RepID=UPI0033F8130D